MTKYWKVFLLLLTMAIAVGCSDDNNPEVTPPDPIDPEVTIEVKEGMNLVGKITDGTSPIQGVVVSDGYSVTTTDADGIYQLAANRDSARFVFISVPAEYEIPLDEKGVPKMYQDISDLTLTYYPKAVVQRDFTLAKAAKKTAFTLVALADVQIGNKDDLAQMKKDLPKIKEYIQTLNAPMYGISLGDLVWDNLPYLLDYRDGMQSLGLPVFQVIGNHDHELKVNGNDLLSAMQYETVFGPTYYSYNIGDCHFVVLDDIEYEGGESKQYEGRITDSQLNWLKQDLAHVDKDKLIIVATHIPTKRRVSSTQVTNNADLYKILEGYNVRILSGHSHYNYTTTISDKIEENTHGAVMGEFWTGEFCRDGAPKGYAIYEINGATIKNWYYKGTEKDKDYQMKVYAPGTSVEALYSKDVLINIFTWHTNWTVTASEDGGKAVEVTRTARTYDPDAYEFLGGPSDDTKPAVRPTLAEVGRTDHILRYTPSNTSWKNIVITATDPYGNTYTQEIVNEGVGVYYEEDFEWLQPWSEVGKAGQSVETDDPGATAPQIKTPVVDGVSALDALLNKGYELLRVTSKNEDPVGECIYLQSNYLKFGKTSYQGGIVLPTLENVPSDGKATLSFDWCPMRQGNGKIDPVNIVVIVTNGSDEVAYDIPESGFETGHQLEWVKAEVQLSGIGKDTKITIRQTQWGVSTANRWFLDNIKLKEAE